MRRTGLPHFTIAVSLCLAAACATASSGASRPGFDAALITRAQIEELHVSTAYDAVKTLRSNWLSARGPESFRYPIEVQVYLDGVHYGDISTLQSIASPPIQYIRYYTGQEATVKWGIDHGRGAIVISTQVARQGKPATPPR